MSVAEETGLKLALTETPKTGFFSRDEAQIHKSKEEDKDQESIQSNATPDPGHCMEK